MSCNLTEKCTTFFTVKIKSLSTKHAAYLCFWTVFLHAIPHRWTNCHQTYPGGFLPSREGSQRIIPLLVLCAAIYAVVLPHTVFIPIRHQNSSSVTPTSLYKLVEAELTNNLMRLQHQSTTSHPVKKASLSRRRRTYPYLTTKKQNEDSWLSTRQWSRTTTRGTVFNHPS